jgi:hypothetical protein
MAISLYGYLILIASIKALEVHFAWCAGHASLPKGESPEGAVMIGIL